MSRRAAGDCPAGSTRFLFWTSLVSWRSNRDDRPAYLFLPKERFLQIITGLDAAEHHIAYGQGLHWPKVYTTFMREVLRCNFLLLKAHLIKVFLHAFYRVFSEPGISFGFIKNHNTRVGPTCRKCNLIQCTVHHTTTSRTTD